MSDVFDEGRPERTFAALPPARGQAFARTWWGQAWLKALEDTALDGQQVKSGRRQARSGAVGAVSVRPGRITAVVRGSGGTAYRADVLLQELSAPEWDRFLDLVADRSGHVAALLDRDMPPMLVEDAGAAGIELLPGIGDLEPECGCDAWDHCAHTSALCFQMARLLDQDPFVLLLVRGRSERELLDELQARSASRAPAPSAVDAWGAVGDGEPEGIPAAEVFAARDILPPLPAAPPPVEKAGVAPALSGGAAPAPGVYVEALEFLIEDAAERAQRLLAQALSAAHGESPPAPRLTVAQDAVRMAARRPGARITARLAAGSGRDVRGLARAVRAWEQGGSAALSVMEEPWSPGARTVARATAELLAAWEGVDVGAAGPGTDGSTGSGEPPRFRVTGNRWTLIGGDVQLRLGRDGTWWPYRRESGQWIPDPDGPGPIVGAP